MATYPVMAHTRSIPIVHGKAEDDLREHQMGEFNKNMAELKKADYEKMHTPVVREHQKVGRNDPCPCGSMKKFKKCCIDKHEVTAS